MAMSGANFSESQIPTPNIDQLALQGMRFTDAHSGAAVCSPGTRYGLLTGRSFSPTALVHHWITAMGQYDR